MATLAEMRTQVTQLYVSLFGRAPEVGGLDYWVGQLSNGKSLATVAQDMYNVPAARTYYPASSTPQETITKFYVNVLGRTPDANGLTYWTGRLTTEIAAKNPTAAGAVIMEMINAVVAYSGSDTAALASQALFNNKVEAGLYYGFTKGGTDTQNTILSAITADHASVDAVKTFLDTPANSPIGATSDSNSAANTVAENAAVGTTVGITALAADANVADHVTYALTTNPGNLFAINETTGVITVNGALDHEAATSHSVTVTATSSDGTTSSQSFAIAVTNVNDNAMSAVADVNAAANTVAEDAAAGTVVGVTAQASDADRGATVTYKLVNRDGTDVAANTGAFAVDAATGVVTVRAAGVLDYEAATSQEILVKATSSDGSSNTQAFAIAVTNANDNALSAVTDSDGATDGSVAENAAVGAVVGVTALATDADRGAVVTYSLDDNAGGRFAINSSTGVVTVASALDHETATTHAITVRATSSDGSAARTAVFNIAVTNVDDNALSAVTDSNVATNTVAENAANGTVVGVTALATDADRGATVTYSLVNNDGTAYVGPFSVDASTGVVTVAGAINYETATSHEIIVKATSGSTSNTQAFTIAVTNVDDNALSAVTDGDGATGGSVAENAAVGAVVGVTALATDADRGAVVTYSLLDNAGGRFAINSSTGVVTVASALDYESATSHTITVQASSSDGSPAQTQSFTINVTDVAETLNVQLTAGTDTPANTGNGNDTFDGRTVANSLNTDDVLNGGLGTDTVTANYSVAGTFRPTLLGVENVDVTDTGGAVSAVTVDLLNADSSLARIRSTQSVESPTFDNVGTNAEVQLVLTSLGATVNYTDAAMAGTGTNVLVSLDNTPTGASAALVTIANAAASTGAAEQITVSSNVGSANAINVQNTTATSANYTLNVQGTQNLTLETTGSNATAINAASASGTLDVTNAGATAFTYAGGSGADTLHVIGAQAVTGITGTETVAIAANGSATAVATDTTNMTVTFAGNNGTATTGAGADTFTAIAAVNVNANGGDGNDTFNFAGNLDANDTVVGGSGTADRINITGNATNAQFTNVTTVEELVQTQANGNLTLGALAAAAGLNSVTAGSGNNTIDLTAFNAAVTVASGAGDDSVTVNLDDAGNKVITSTTVSGTAETTYDAFTVNATDAGGAGTAEATVTFDASLVGNGTNNNVTIDGANVDITVDDEGIQLNGANAGQFAVNDGAARGQFQTIILGTNAAAETLTAAASATYINGGEGADTLVLGGAVNHYGVGGLGGDTFTISGTGQITAVGGEGADTFDVSGVGDVNLQGDAGANTFNMAGTLTTADTVAGGADADTMTVEGTRADAAFTNVSSVETLTLNNVAANIVTLGQQANEAGIATVNDTGAQNDTITIAASGGANGTGFANALTVNVRGGNDTVTNSANIALTLNVKDTTAAAGASAGNLTDADALAGGTGTDTLNVEGAATRGAVVTTTLTAANFVSGFETINLNHGTQLESAVTGAANDLAGSANIYNIAIDNGNVGATATLTVNASGLRAGVITDLGTDGELGGAAGAADTATDETLTFDASALSNGGKVSVTGGGANDNLTGGSGADTIVGGAGNDTLAGGQGNDTMSSVSGDNVFNGGAGRDTLTGGTGADTFVMTTTEFENDSDVVAGNGGTDQVRMTSDAATHTVADVGFAVRFTSIESLALSGDDNGTANTAFTYNAGTYAEDAGIRTISVIGEATGNVSAAGYNSNAVTLLGGAGQDTLTGTAFADSINGGADADTLNGGEGNDTLTGGLGADTINTGEGANTVNLDGGNDTATGGTGVDTFVMSAAGNVSINAGDGNDVITAASYLTDADTIVGGAATDSLTINGAGAATTLSDQNNISGVETITLQGSGLAAANTYDVTIDNDNAPTSGALTINASGLLADSNGAAAGVAAETMSLNAGAVTAYAINVTGGGAADTVVGGTNADTIDGGDGADSINAAAGADSITAGEGADTVVGGAGNDAIVLSETTLVSDVVRYVEKSAAAEFDTITGFDAASDSDAVTAGVQTANQDVVQIALAMVNGTYAEAVKAQGDILSSGVNIISDVVTGGAETAVKVATFLQTNDFSAIDAGSANKTSVIVLKDTTDSYIWQYTGDANVNVNASEFKLIAKVSGVTTLGLANFDASPNIAPAAFTLNMGAFDANAYTGTEFNFHTWDGKAIMTHTTPGNDVHIRLALDGGSSVRLNFAGGGSGFTTANFDLPITYPTTGFGAGGTVTAPATSSVVVPNVESSSFGSTAMTLAGGAGDDMIFGTTGGDSLTGGNGADTLVGGNGADTIEGGAGADALYGGAGADSMTGDAGADNFVLVGNDTVVDFTSVDDTVDLTNLVNGNAVTFTTVTGTLNLSASATTASFTATAAPAGATITGGAGNDSLVGAAGNDSLTGSGGVDTITGAGGNDTIDGGAGIDSVTGGAGDDRISTSVASADIDAADGGADTDTLVLTGAAAGTVVIDLSVAANADQLTTINGLAQASVQSNFENINASAMTGGGISLTGSSGANTITGSAQADTITGGAGVDDLTGGAGNDTFNYAVGDASTVGFADVGTTGSTAVAPDANDTYTGTEVIRDLVTGDTVNLGHATIAADAGTVGTLEDDEYLLVSGTYAGNVFTVGGANTSTLVIYDADSGTVGVQQEAIVLVGVAAAEAAAIVNTAGVLSVFGA